MVFIDVKQLRGSYITVGEKEALRVLLTYFL
jgi:hypothetical protein